MAEFRETAIRRHETLDHRCDDLGGLDGFAAFAAKDLRICDEIAVKSSGQFHREFHRLVVFERP
ncbi:hypothetical protein ADL19_11250 [Streptomyces purpurogeneiscleroticus]|nr:hypothetical protein ADL19_11250 [Streptomyces purpurogeneiscleroticus]